MRIGIDARLINETGVGRYIRNIITQLSSLDDKNEYFLYLNKKGSQIINKLPVNFHQRRVDIPWHTIEEQLRMPKILLNDDLDIAHFPYFNVPLLYPKKYLLTIHDLIVDHFDTGRASTLSPLLYRTKRVAYKIDLKIGIRKAAKISVISKTTKKEVMDHYGVKDEKIIVTYDALDERYKNLTDNQKPKNYFNFPYILYVGNAYPHKNLLKLFSAFKSLISKYRNLKLVLAGDDPFFYKRMREHCQKENLNQSVFFFGEANDENLVNLYKFAECLVFPSLMEGFGLPNLEAVYSGLIPVVSDIPVFREIWDDSLIFFDPRNSQDISQKLFICLKMTPMEKKKILLKAYDKLNKYSWKNTACKTLELYKDISE